MKEAEEPVFLSLPLLFDQWCAVVAWDSVDDPPPPVVATTAAAVAAAMPAPIATVPAVSPAKAPAPAAAPPAAAPPPTAAPPAAAPPPAAPPAAVPPPAAAPPVAPAPAPPPPPAPAAPPAPPAPPPVPVPPVTPAAPSSWAKTCKGTAKARSKTRKQLRTILFILPPAFLYIKTLLKRQPFVAPCKSVWHGQNHLVKLFLTCASFPDVCPNY